MISSPTVSHENPVKHFRIFGSEYIMKKTLKKRIDDPETQATLTQDGEWNQQSKKVQRWTTRTQ